MDAVQEALARGEQPIKLTKTSSKTGHSICFDCEHAIKDCAWSREWKAIPGWTAELVYLDRQITMHVIDCPEFEETPERETTAGAMSDRDNREFLKDPIRYLETHGVKYRSRDGRGRRRNVIKTMEGKVDP